MCILGSIRRLIVVSDVSGHECRRLTISCVMTRRAFDRVRAPILQVRGVRPTLCDVPSVVAKYPLR